MSLTTETLDLAEPFKLQFLKLCSISPSKHIWLKLVNGLAYYTLTIPLPYYSSYDKDESHPIFSRQLIKSYYGSS